MRYGRENWTIEVPANWEVIDDPQCLTLDRPEGALQFSSARKTEGTIDMMEIERVASRSGSCDWGQPKEVTAGEFAGLVFDHHEGERLWRRWFLFQENTLVLVTFNSDVETSEQLQCDINETVGTLRLESIRPNNIINRTANALRAWAAGYRSRSAP
jgi:hypothetical protein